jgi:hypothetical protein
MDILIYGHYHDGDPIEGYLCHVSGDHHAMLENDDDYFYYFVGDYDIVGEHPDFVVTKFERA